jgi:hypothetical protein
MTQVVSHFQEVVSQLRQMLPANTATAQATGRHEPWERIAMQAVDGGNFETADEVVRLVAACLQHLRFESADDFVRFIEACLRHVSFEPDMTDRAYANGIRNLADAIARRGHSEDSTGKHTSH